MIDRIICKRTQVIQLFVGLLIDPNQTDLMSRDTKVGIVTAAGYTDAERYYGRLHGLLEAIKVSDILTPTQKQNLVIMGKYSYSPDFGHMNFDLISVSRRRI